MNTHPTSHDRADWAPDPAQLPDGTPSPHLRSQHPRRRHRALAVATVFTLAAGIWGGTNALTHRPAQVTVTPAPAAATADNTAAPSEATAEAAALASSTTTKHVTKNVTHKGEPLEGQGRVTWFTSPTGNLWCAISAVKAECTAHTWSKNAAKYGCEGEDDPKDGDVVYLGKKGRPTWTCQHDAFGFPALRTSDGYDMFPKGVAWWDWEIGTTASYQYADKGAVLAALRYGNSLRAGDFTCTMATSGVTCTNGKTGHGFRFNKAGGKTY